MTDCCKINKVYMVKAVFLIWVLLTMPVRLFAQYFDKPALLVPYIENAPEVNSRAAVLIDAETGTLLYSKNPDEEIPPASLTKLMTMHLVMKAVKEGRASYDEIIPVTVESWARNQPRGSSLMFIAPGQTVSLRELMLGTAVSSGNDSSVALALRLSSSMSDFAELMTMEARAMGLHVTRFTESSGISEFNITTASEFTHFCRQYINLHPESLKEFHSVESFAYPLSHNVAAAFRNDPRTILQDNRNSLLKTFSGADGLKTGFIYESGYNLALTAERNNTRLISVTLGADSVRSRNADGERLLSWAFENFKTVRPVIDRIESPRLWKSRENFAELKITESLDFISPSERAGFLYFETEIPEPLIAPLPLGFKAGYLVIFDEYGEVKRAPLFTSRAYERGNIFKRIWHSILLFFNKKKDLSAKQ